MIVRPYYLDILKTYRDVPLVKILAGIRRCGKSTILDMLKDDLLGSGIADAEQRIADDFAASSADQYEIVNPYENERINNVLFQVGMHDKGYKLPHDRSGGEQQRIVIARALLNDPVLILADEPTGNLDPETSGQIVQLLHDICRKGTAVIMTTHNYTLVHNYPARIVKCENACLSDVGE